jgi:hypothetical protein
MDILGLFPDRVMPEPNSGCWIWTGSVIPSKGTNGYATLNLDGPIFGHRFSYEISCGEIADGKYVMHKCDNSLCVNPHHLEVGSQSKNISDAYRRGRLKYGEKHAKAKLTSEAVAEILSISGRAPDGFNRAMSRKYGVSLGAIEKIRCRQNWRISQ